MSHDFEDSVIAHLGVMSDLLAKISSDLSHLYLATIAGLDDNEVASLKRALAHHRMNVEVEQFCADLDDLPEIKEN